MSLYAVTECHGQFDARVTSPRVLQVLDDKLISCDGQGQVRIWDFRVRVAGSEDQEIYTLTHNIIDEDVLLTTVSKNSKRKGSVTDAKKKERKKSQHKNSDATLAAAKSRH